MKIKQKPQLHASWIDHHAREIVRVLQREGFKSYLVGGCVRDLLAGFHPKDYDIATNALPNQVKRKVWGSYVIGKRFRLVLAKRGDQQYEIATFRQAGPVESSEPSLNEVTTGPETTDSHDILENVEIESAMSDNSDNEIPPSDASLKAEGTPEKVRMKEDNFFGTPEQDAVRRDFTINALFYDPINDELIDYVNGLEDIKNQIIRIIGDPEKRIQEDPIRIFRAIRLSHKLGFKIDPALREAIAKNAATVAHSVLPRRREEFLKLLRLPDPVPAFLELYDLGVLEHSLPGILPIFENSEKFEIFRYYLHQIDLFCENTQSPSELMIPLILGFLRAMENDPEKESLLNRMMKDELMIFKSEQAAIFSAIDLVQSLNSIENFQKRGQRRQQSFLQNESLPAALKIAKSDFLISPVIFQFWKEKLKQPLSS